MRHPNPEHVAAVRRFNRFYTRQVGALNEGLLRSPYSLTQMRVLYELAHAAPQTSQALCAGLGLDPGYLSRILAQFEAEGLVERHRDQHDGRRLLVTLTERGRETFAPYDRASAEEVGDVLARIDGTGRQTLVDAMATIERLLSGTGSAEAAAAAAAPAVELRAPRPGEFGWIVHRHGALYAEEYGFDATFEALVAEIVADFIKSHDPARERVWIADAGGRVAGSVFLVRKTDTVARLRLLYVEPWARGLGIGRRLVDACITAAREQGYAELELWTNDVLTAARHIYQRAGFDLVDRAPHRSFGRDLVGETWRLAL